MGKVKSLDKFKGCLIGGAIGDALGYAVEFSSLDTILSEYGEGGIVSYKLRGGKAFISDDTQMTLFTANGLLRGRARASAIGTEYMPAAVWDAYRDWLITQNAFARATEKHSWLINVPELRNRRAPGRTCLESLEESAGGTIESPINDSKGCGGVMRAAPVGLFFIGEDISADKVDMLGAEIAALTHGHELGYIPAAALTHIVYAVASGEKDLRKAVEDSLTAVKKLFPHAVYLDYFTELIERAIELSRADMPDTQAIAELGQGWVAEETLAIAVYCALRYGDDFEKAIIASVNHEGDSDSTGAVTGNILGALLGLEKIPERFLPELELRSVIEEIAQDLHTGYSDGEQWKSKYIDCDYVI